MYGVAGVPGDPVLAVTNVDVARDRRVIKARRRMTLTYPVLNRARNILWLITDEPKADALVRLMKGDRTIPAGQIRSDRAQILADRAAASRARESLNDRAISGPWPLPLTPNPSPARHWSLHISDFSITL